MNDSISTKATRGPQSGFTSTDPEADKRRAELDQLPVEEQPLKARTTTIDAVEVLIYGRDGELNQLFSRIHHDAENFSDIGQAISTMDKPLFMTMEPNEIMREFTRKSKLFGVRVAHLRGVPSAKEDARFAQMVWALPVVDYGLLEASLVEAHQQQALLKHARESNERAARNLRHPVRSESDPRSTPDFDEDGGESLEDDHS